MNISRYVDDKLTVIVMTSWIRGMLSRSRVAHGVAGIYVGALKGKEKD